MTESADKFSTELLHRALKVLQEQDVPEPYGFWLDGLGYVEATEGNIRKWLKMKVPNDRECR